MPVAPAVELFQFCPELLNSGGSRRYIFVEFAKRKVEDYGRAIRSGRARASTWIEDLQHWSEWFGGAGSAFKRGSVPSSKPVVWGEQHQKALEKLLDHLTSAPVLGYPDFSQPFVLHTDASQEGLGAVLYQRQDGKMRVTGYGSRSLTKAERNYHLHSGKLEFLALRWAVCEHFRDYLYYAPHFVMYTDNNPLTCWRRPNWTTLVIAGC